MYSEMGHLKHRFELLMTSVGYCEYDLCDTLQLIGIILSYTTFQIGQACK